MHLEAIELRGNLEDGAGVRGVPVEAAHIAHDVVESEARALWRRPGLLSSRAELRDREDFEAADVVVDAVRTRQHLSEKYPFFFPRIRFYTY